MLSSVLSLSSSKGFVGLLYIGARVMLSTVLAGFSDGVKNGLSATRTTEIILSPTKSVLSNGNLSNPYMAAMGYATVILITLFLILRAKGSSYTSPCSPGPSPPPTSPSPEYPVPSASKSSPGGAPPSHNHSGMGSEPPSPPPDPGSDSADDTPRRSPWWLLLLLVVLAAGSYIYFTRNPDSSVVLAKTLGSQIAWRMERCFLDISNAWTAAVSPISTARIYILQHGRHIATTTLLGLATHGVCFVVLAALRHLCLYLVPRHPTSYAPICFWISSITALVSLPQLRWMLWMEYYISTVAVRDIPSTFRISWSSSMSDSCFSAASVSISPVPLQTSAYATFL
ncbi:hypothetical protein B0H16DRAFT_1886783 [Mycena metata]|uniref:Uncharacterized protein n=1 Tax=Mycena metata TaxID=1033252 RepID=A0AAD7NAK0_9AGAR|nr:hypothetical protein B0H16DRAFT_1886783 [Mycena metata]